MTLNETLLRKLSEWRPAGSGRHILATTHEASGWNASVSSERCDSMGCLVWEFAVNRKSAATGSTLSGWAERAAQRVTSLADPLKVVEIDEGRGEAILRSEQPSQRGDRVLYYELHLRGTTSATVHRYQAKHAPGTHREQIAFALTHEALAKLAGDLTAEK